MISFLLSVRLPFRYALVLIYVGLIMTLSLIPPQSFPKLPLFEGADKLVHIMMYLVFSVLSSWALKIELYRQRVWLIIPVIIGWGILMEFIQLEMRIGRSFSWYDILANTTGATIGILFYLLVSRSAFKKMIGQTNL